MTQWFDIALLIVLAVLLPIFGAVNHRRAVQQLAAGKPYSRIQGYWWTMALEWGLVAFLVPLWWTAGRSSYELGFAWQGDWREYAGLLATLAACAALFWQARSFRQQPEQWDTLRQQMDGLEFLLPHDDDELKVFNWLSVTAGICEEILYRGHLIWLLTATAGSWIAFFGSSLIFALGHSYQGVRGMVRVFAIGLVTAALFFFTGSLWAPILLHVVIDLTSGRMVHTLLSDKRDGGDAQPALGTMAG